MLGAQATNLLGEAEKEERHGKPNECHYPDPAEPRRQAGACSRAILRAAGVVDVAYSDERPSRGPQLSEAPPTGVLTEVLGGLALYYGACCLYYRSAPHRWEKMW
jgi:hypothetical protein